MYDQKRNGIIEQNPSLIIYEQQMNMEVVFIIHVQRKVHFKTS